MPPLSPDNIDDPIAAYVKGGFALLQAGQTVAQALADLRKGNLSERIIYFYVADAEGRLAGVVPTRRLLMSPPERLIAEIMDRRVVSIPARATVADACEIFVTRRLLAFPVVDADGRMLGVVDVSLFTDEVFELSERQSARDVFQLIGIRVLGGRRASLWSQFRGRFLWLLCNIAGGIACAFLAGRYEAFLDATIVLAFFIPVVLTLSESVSIQSMTLTLQALHGEEFDAASLWASLRREALTALLLAGACGGTVGLVAWAWKQDPLVAAAIACSIGFSIMTACLLGVALPTALRLFKADPEIAAGPVVLAITDVLTLLFYFNLAGLLLH